MNKVMDRKPLRLSCRPSIVDQWCLPGNSRLPSPKSPRLDRGICSTGHESISSYKSCPSRYFCCTINCRLPKATGSPTREHQKCPAHRIYRENRRSGMLCFPLLTLDGLVKKSVRGECNEDADLRNQRVRRQLRNSTSTSRPFLTIRRQQARNQGSRKAGISVS